MEQDQNTSQICFSSAHLLDLSDHWRNQLIILTIRAKHGEGANALVGVFFMHLLTI